MSASEKGRDVQFQNPETGNVEELQGRVLKVGARGVEEVITIPDAETPTAASYGDDNPRAKIPVVKGAEIGFAKHREGGADRRRHGLL